MEVRHEVILADEFSFHPQLHSSQRSVAIRTAGESLWLLTAAIQILRLSHQSSYPESGMGHPLPQLKPVVLRI
jgi:hypothetical protein